jgi:hypothetical protein
MDARDLNWRLAGETEARNVVIPTTEKQRELEQQITLSMSTARLARECVEREKRPLNYIDQGRVLYDPPWRNYSRQRYQEFLRWLERYRRAIS